MHTPPPHLPPGKRPSLSLPLLRESRAQERAGRLTVGNLLEALGERSFGWALLVFSLLTLLPLPPGTTLVTALPLLLVTGQMALGFPHVILPAALARRPLNQARLRRAMLGLRPVTRRLERVVRPRGERLFRPALERPLGVVLFAIAFALFLPVPFTGWFPALSLFVIGVGLVERDGLVAGMGLGAGLLSVALTASIILMVATGAQGLLNTPLPVHVKTLAEAVQTGPETPLAPPADGPARTP